VGAGHHGPKEWVSLSSLVSYRQALGDFVDLLPDWYAGSTGGASAPDTLPSG
jgi:hypothetical protein